MGPSNNLWWCENCGVPLLRKKCENCGYEGVSICSDLKPIFNEECRFLEKETSKKLPAQSWHNGLWIRHKTIWFNGEKLLRLSANGKPTIAKGYPYKDSLYKGYITPNIIYKANKVTLDKLEKEAILFIKDIIKSHPERKPIVSFSGGKDSTVVSYLVRKALMTNRILHIFGDTTIEYPDTYNYIKKFSRHNGVIPFYTQSSNHSFLKMCNLLSPPSMLNSWCCSVFKASPISEMIKKLNNKGGVISFEGVRRKESARRRNRQSTYLNKKIVHQLSAYPILEWREIEVWLFILTKKLEFNNAYRKGLPRVGCMYCPYTNAYNEYLISKLYQKDYKKWFQFLIKFAKSVEKANPREYVLSGAWKKRIGKSNNQSIAYARKVPCLKNPNAMHFILDKKVNGSFIERFKPFGKIEKFKDQIGQGFVVRDPQTSEGIFMIKIVKNIKKLKEESSIDPNWKLGKEFLCVDILTTKNVRRLIQAIERQIRKFQECVLCGACIGICPTNAIAINPHFKVFESACLHCKRCITTRVLRDSCVALHSNQQTKRYRDGNRL
ncbi:MAG: hypothetical protein CVU88_07170 [Firmicutes bacterium HGW-Firmicutes-13]|nr:MAG: hypothetical protein CVU88_07170 [Firmicutes bacterium HGW-Firmicutes-13]